MRALTAALVVAALAITSGAQTASFDEFLAAVREEALARGIRAGTVDAAFAGLTPQPVVVQRDRAQPEQTLSLDQYVTRRTTAATIKIGRASLDRHGSLLRRVEEAFGVPPPVIVAIWGLESSFGRFTGTYPTVRALATLAYDGRRPLFRQELLHALAILDRGDVPVDRLKGSWAGAMGQPQFMPSSFLERAVDFDGDGHVDIWSSPADIFASMANYLQAAGWTAGFRWGREVAITPQVMARIEETVPMRRSGCRALREMTEVRPLDAWAALGVRLPAGGALPTLTIDASLVRGDRRHFLVYGNYEAVLSYNCSNAYAVSVGLLADRLAAR